MLQSFDTNDMLTYVREYKIVVCRKCRYAIQPSALSSHLLRHGIYREDRRQLLNELTDLPLLDPELVPLPTQITKPCKELPVYDGRKCLAPVCSYLCLSEKRMSQHWSEDHRSNNVKSRPARLQTFFRGNKLRYFEVDWVESMQDSVSFPAISWNKPTRNRSGNLPDKKQPQSHSPPVNLTEQITSPTETETLQLMHNYTASTYRAMCVVPDDEDFWKLQIPHEAFNHDYLLRGLLSLSAIHLAFLANESANVELMSRYIRMAAYHQSIGLPLFRAALAAPTMASSNALVAFSRITGSMRTCEARLEWLTTGRKSSAGESDASTLVEFLMLFKGTEETFLDMQEYLPEDSNFLISMLLKEELNGVRCQKTAPKVQNAYVKNGPDTSSSPEDMNALGTEFKALIKSSSPAKRQTLLSARQNLLRCLDVCKGYHRHRIVWKAVSLFALSVTADYCDLLAAKNPAALILYAHWALLFDKLPDHHWFVTGQSAYLIGVIRDLLDKKHARLLPSIE